MKQGTHSVQIQKVRHTRVGRQCEHLTCDWQLYITLTAVIEHLLHIWRTEKSWNYSDLALPYIALCCKKYWPSTPTHCLFPKESPFVLQESPSSDHNHLTLDRSSTQPTLSQKHTHNYFISFGNFQHFSESTKIWMWTYCMKGKN